MLTVKENGRVTDNVTADLARELGYSDEAIAEAEARFQADTARRVVRREIAKKAGDEASLLGTTADGAQLAIYGLAALVAKLSTAQSLAEVREAAAPFAALSAGFLAKINTENPTEGEVVLPFMLKGLDQVVADIENRATAVSDALQAAQKG